MIVSGASIARVALVVLAAFLLQLSGIGQVRLLGGSFDLIPMGVIAVAYFAGSVPGAITGFCAGLLLDLVLGRELGASALVLTSLGYVVGRYRELRDPAHGLAPIAVAAAGTAGYLIASAAVSFMLGFEASVSLLVLRDIVMTVLLNSLLALPVFWLVGKLLRPALLNDPFRRRRPRERRAGPLGLRGLEV
jgi:rod shape-determining protein MreD